MLFLSRLLELIVTRQRRIFATVFLAALAMAAVVTFALPKEYRAEATLFVGENRSISTGAGALQLDEELARTYVSLLRTPEVTEAVVRDLPFKLDAAALESKVSAEVTTGTRLIRLQAFDGRPQRARQLADTYATTFVGQQRTSSAAASRGQLNELRSNIGALGQQVQGLQGATAPADVARRSVAETELQSAREAFVATQGSLALQGADLSVASRAMLPTAPARPRPKLYLALGFLLALALATTATALADRFDDRLRGEAELPALLGAPVLARIPLEAVGREAMTAEAFDLLRTNLHAGASGPHQVIAVTSSLPGEGKSFAVKHLAMAFARLGTTVLAVDCDLRRRGLGASIGAGELKGVSNLLVEPPRDPRELVSSTSMRGVHLLAAGPSPPSPSALLGLRRMGELLGGLANHYDHVVVDSAPVTIGADTTALAAAVDAVILVVDLDRAGRRALTDAATQVTRTGTPIIGVVINRVGAREYAYGSYTASAASQGPAANGAGAQAPAAPGREWVPRA